MPNRFNETLAVCRFELFDEHFKGRSHYAWMRAYRADIRVT